MFSEKELQNLRESGRILREILKRSSDFVEVGKTPQDIEHFVDKLFEEYKVTPAFKGYQGFPSSICISVNDQVVHGIPNDEPLLEGDVVGLDCGVTLGGMITDSAVTVPVGGIDKCTPEVARLLEVTETVLDKVIKKIKPGVMVGELSNFIATYVRQRGFEVVADLGGHGVGRDVHEEPFIPNEGPKSLGPNLFEGQVIAIEPITTLGTNKMFVDLEDGWTIYTQDHAVSAHFEHTLYIGKDGAEILT